MGFYNILKSKVLCPYCKSEVDALIQFKYGEKGIRSYSIGDKIVFGKNNFGEKGKKEVILTGISEECSLCNENGEYYIWVKEDEIKSISISDGRYGFSELESDYFVIKE